MSQIINTIKSAIKKYGILTGWYRPGAFSRLFNQDYLAKFNQETSFYSTLLKPSDLCFDVGANIGEKSEVLLKVGANVIAFEPQPDCVQELQARCIPYRNKLEICQSAVGAEIGEAELYISSYSSATSSFFQDWSEGSTTIKVPMTTLDQAITKFGIPSYCKIDVEGWEFEVLKGLTQRIPLISIEYHLGQREVDIVIDCLSYLSRFGELLINITTAENLEFALPEWVTLEQFLELFPSNFQGRYEYRYGDIFIRTLIN
jgi:FkbM family methyltransferase